MSVTSGTSGSVGAVTGGTRSRGKHGHSGDTRDDGYTGAAFACVCGGGMRCDGACGDSGMGGSLGRALNLSGD